MHFKYVLLNHSYKLKSICLILKNSINKHLCNEYYIYHDLILFR